MRQILPPMAMQPHSIPRFGMNNPFVLGVPGMGGFGGMPKPMMPMGGQIARKRKPKIGMRQFMPQSPFMGQFRPY